MTSVLSSRVSKRLSVKKIGANKPIDTPKQPWVSSPYSLVTWWDMEKFSAEAFYEIGKFLGKMAEVFDNGPILADDPLSEVNRKDWLQEEIGWIVEQCEELDLHVSAKCAEDFLTRIGLEDTTIGNVRNLCEQLGNTIRFEMQTVHFFHLPSRQAAFYRQDDLFGADVSAKFPDVQYDIIEAGNCYAFGRSTACVFHLMRVMERGVQTLGGMVNIQFAETKDWGDILRLFKLEIEKQTIDRPLHGKDHEVVQWNQLHAYLTTVKNGWRNRVMHPHDKYTLDEAEDLIGHVKSFMKTLAKSVKPTSAATTTIQ